MADVHDLGVFSTLELVWKSYPSGGCPGDYVTIGAEVVYWNQYRNIWGESGDVVSTPDEQHVEGNLTVDGNLTVGGKTTGDAAEFNSLKVDNIEVTNSPFADKAHNHDGIYSKTGHNHDGVYAPKSHRHAASDIDDFPGGGSGGSVDIVSEDSVTVPSDTNVFSSKRTLKEIILNNTILGGLFLRKDIADTASAIITFAKGLISKEDAIFEKNVGAKTVTAEASVTSKQLIATEKVTSLDAVITGLAKAYNLTVENTADIMHGIIRQYLSSEVFVSGFLGEGFKIWKDGNGLWCGEFDKLTVRKTFYVFELVVQRIVHQGGMVIRSAAGGKLTKVTDGGTYWKCEHDSTDDFVVDDQVLCQTFTGTSLKRYWRLVTSSGAGYFNMSKADCEADSGTPESGDEVAVLGNRTNADRQSAQIDCSVGVNAPYRDDYTGINSYSLSGKLINRTGNLEGIVDADFGALNGSGFYGKNVYLKGIFKLRSGKTVEETIDGLQATYHTEIISTNGTIFKNDVIDSTLTARVFKGNEDVTSTIPQSSFVWIRKSSNSTGDDAWNIAHATMASNILNITGADVDSKAVFTCLVTIDY